MNIYYTDYPITELGDPPSHPAPLRICNILSYDGDKYCEVEIHGVKTKIKTGYIFKQVSRDELREIKGE